MMARRTAGRLGCGGGPPAGGGVRLFPPSADRLEAQVLQVGEGDAGHQRVAVQAGPRPPLEMAETQLLLELLVPLLADPACLDRRGERTQRRAGRQVAEVVLALAARAPVAHQPHLVA